MKRIIIHHTGGTYTPNRVDKNAYHYIISGSGEVYKGIHKPEDNENCYDGNYAAHTRGGNTNSIGIAFACNLDYSISSPNKTKFPLTREQFESGCKLTAELMKKYHISIYEVYTHYGFDKLHNIKQGKSDITFIPWEPKLNKDLVESYIKNKVMWYYEKL